MVAILLAFADEETRSKYERLYVRYGNPLYRIIFSILKEEHLAQDALQECFIKIFLNLDHIEDIDSYRTKAYLTAVAKTTAINLYRKEKRVRDVTEPEEISLYDVKSDFNVEEILANAELSKNLRKYVTNLVGHMQFDKSTGKLLDLINNNELKTEFTPASKGVTAIIDPDGYYYQGDYTVDLGYVISAAALILMLVTRGYSTSRATSIASGVVGFGINLIYIEGELWMKQDEIYDYSKKIESVYERVSENDNRLGGYTLLQKKAR